jgi:hypothetical protein
MSPRIRSRPAERVREPDPGCPDSTLARVVSQLTSTATNADDNGKPWRRRSALPVLITVAVLIVLGVVTWARALTTHDGDQAPMACPAPSPASTSAAPVAPNAAGGTPVAAAPTKFEVLSPNDMITVHPAPLAASTVRVLNASGQSGKAEEIAAALKDYGFNTPATGGYGNDPLYPTGMACMNQIRFGNAGTGAAAALWVLAPCSELVNDGRRDAVVDLSLGSYFTSLDASADAQEVLRMLRAAPANAADGGANPALVAAVHNRPCSASN